MSRFDLGVGLALMPGLIDAIDSVVDLVDCLEVEPQTFWWETGDAAEPYRLERDEIISLTRRFDAILAHGVSSPVGGSRRPHPFMARLFRDTVDLLGAQLASEHLSFNEATSGSDPATVFSSAFFLPPRQTWAGVDAAAAAIGELRTGMTIPFSVETPVSYLRPRADEIDDGAFVAAVAERADCGILLDLHNIWANQRNGRQDARSYVAQLPLDRVWEVHLAGGLERRGYWLDAHSGGLHPALIELAEDVLAQLPAVRAVVYEILPEFVTQDGVDVLRPDLEQVRRLVDRARLRPARRSPTVAATPTPDPRHCAGPDESAELWENSLAMLAIGRSPLDDQPIAGELARDPAIGLLRELVGAGRSGRVVSSLPLTIELLVTTLGIEGVDGLLDDYAATTEPALWGSAEGRQFAEWAARALADLQYVQAAIRLDRAALDSVLTEQPQTIELTVDPIALITAIHNQQVPTTPFGGRFLATVGG